MSKKPKLRQPPSLNVYRPGADLRWTFDPMVPDAGNHQPHIEGYLAGFELLLRRFRQDRHDRGLFYPAAFLLRHTIELLLKEDTHVAELYWHAAGTPPGDLWRTHDLARLAEYYETAVCRGSRLGPGWQDHRKFLNEWQTDDEDGAFLRYNRQVGGSPIPTPNSLSFEILAKNGRAAEDELEGCRIWLEAVRIGEPLAVLQLTPRGRELVGFPRNFSATDEKRMSRAHERVKSTRLDQTRTFPF
jgi:hypothetical protein